MSGQPPQTVTIGTAQIRLNNVQLRADITLDEVHLDGGDVRLTAPDGEEPARVATGETRFRAVISEPNLNRMLEANLPPDMPIRNLRAVLLSGKVRFTGQFVKLVAIPLALEAVPRVENGVRVWLDWQGLQTGFKIPATVVEALELRFNKTIDLSQSPIPVYIEEARCEPGRVTILGRARIVWPPALPETASSPFSASPPLPSAPEAPPLPASPTPGALPPAAPHGSGQAETL